MSIFKEVTLTWAGEDFTVNPDDVLMLIATVEDIVSVDMLYNGGAKLPRAKLAMAYAAALTFAGAKGVDAETIYKAMFTKADAMTVTENAVMGLLKMMLPPDEHKTDDAGEAPKKD